MNELSFSYNWNNKLDCKVFTTLRLNKWLKVGDKIGILLKNAFKGYGTIVGKKVLSFDKINDWIAYLDTGYDAVECREILKKIYKNKDIDWTTQKIYYYLIRSEK